MFSFHRTDLSIKVIRHHGIDIKRTKVVESVDDLWFKQNISYKETKWAHFWTNELVVEQMSPILDNWTQELIF